jgi:hypothetical protein
MPRGQPTSGEDSGVSGGGQPQGWAYAATDVLHTVDIA